MEKLGGANQWRLEEALKDLSSQYKSLSGNLCIRVEDTKKILEELVEKTDAQTIYFNARFEPEAFSLQEQIAKRYPCEVFNGNHLIDPREIEVSKDKPYSVFTPFYKACLKNVSVPSSPPLPKKLDTLSAKSDSLAFEHEKWMKKLEHHWIPTRKEGLKVLKQFTASGIKKYKQDRDFPAIEGTSKLSPYLLLDKSAPMKSGMQQSRGKTIPASFFGGNYARKKLSKITCGSRESAR